ncbi:MAG: VWA domain-containing protein [Anaerolineales bacterium]|nr:VWA domain-containing protein [Anaerolineales bacterium]
MRSLRPLLTRFARVPAVPQRRPASRGERGQALVIIAMAMIGLLAFIGLTVDAGILYIGVGHLRRAVDAAALAASAQFREGREVEQQVAAAREVVHLNGVDPTSLELWLCNKNLSKADPLDPVTHHDPSLCPNPGELRRKLIRIRAATEVRFAFLTIIGFHSTEISAQAVSEAASVDIVLVIDTSNSMTFDVPSSDPMWAPSLCNVVSGGDDIPGECHPFEEVKQAAANFVERLNFPYDRVAVVTFALTPTVVIPLTNTLTPADIIDTILNLEVSPPRQPPGYPYEAAGCVSLVPEQDVSGCQNTSIGGGLKYGGNEFGRAPIRQESVWVLVLLTDGAANASEDDASVPTLNKFCPPSTWGSMSDPLLPYCRDQYNDTRHTVLTPTIWIAGAPGNGIPPDPGHTAPYNPDHTYGALGSPLADYDTEDFARDMADFVACAPTYGDAAQWCRDSLNYIADEGGQGAVIFAIGLGDSVVENYTTPRDAGDSLLKYVANVGLDGDPDPTPSGGTIDPCFGIPAPNLTVGNDDYTCGNYYFSESGTGLNAVFEAIASRIFTRLTQ